MPNSRKGGETLIPTSILNLVSTPRALGKTTTTAPATTTIASLAKDAALFSSTLGDVLSALTTTQPSTSSPQIASNDDGLVTNLVKQIRDQLDRGISLDAIVQELAASLATQVASQLGVSTHAAHERLTHAFSEALSARGQGPPGTNAERASTLATRFDQLAKLAARVANGEAGPTIRSIAGTSLDADTAGADPTPKTTTDGPAVASLLTPNPIPPSPVPPKPATASDRRTVAVAPEAAIASGGDTLLGRMLARAFLAGDRPAPSAAAPVRVESPSRAATSTTSASSTTGSIAAAGYAVAPVTSQNSVEAFVHAFAAALAHEDAPRAATGRDDAPSIEAAAPRAATPPDSDPAAVPFPSAIAHTSGAATSVPTAPAAQAPAVDPHAVVEQLVRAMAIQTAGDGTSTVRLRLVPEHLGDVTVKLVVSAGTVDATLTAHTPDAQNALAGGHAQLAKTLADAGLKLQSFNVGLAGGGFGSTGERSGERHAPHSSSVRRAGGVANDEPDPTSEDDLLAAPSFGPPIYTPSGSLGALNYLV